MISDWKTLASDITSLLGLQWPPVAISFSERSPLGVARYDGPEPEPTPDGRTGKVSAGCVFWVEATSKSFTTIPEDHGNCSIGSLTHGLKTIEQVMGNSDVAGLLESGWLSIEEVPHITVVNQRPNYITYGPLSEATYDPDVILLRLNAKQVMVLHDALPGLLFEGKPQCHIIAIAKEQKRPAVSVGCMLSRVRTGIPNSEMTCALPADRLSGVVASLRTTSAFDRAVAAFASDDAKRFG